MAVVKVIELIAQSEKSWEDAARAGLQEAAKTIHGIQSMWIKDMQAVVKEDKIVQYRLNAKLSFVVNDKRNKR
jgi:flavin-binding protein dodecin